MIINKQRIGDVSLLAVEGVIKLGESARFLADALKRSLADGEGHVLLDLSDVNYMDSTGIGELVGYLVRLRAEERKLILVRPSERIVQLLTVAGVASLFPTYDTVEDALAEEAGGT
ncbi:MAG: STAS domain-containing protein [Acidobacteriota bacterium]|nr:STAS domain-containing protein [Acidobacteriota bacterium]MDE3263733.1 STAS domain-containing protein [Acidobacteriota bacterium]